jgi:hypothetical protein
MLTNQKVATLMLRKLGCTCRVVAGNGEQARGAAPGRATDIRRRADGLPDAGDGWFCRNPQVIRNDQSGALQPAAFRSSP